MLCFDGGLYRSVDGYDYFDVIEKEIRKVSLFGKDKVDDDLEDVLVYLCLG